VKTSPVFTNVAAEASQIIRDGCEISIYATRSKQILVSHHKFVKNKPNLYHMINPTVF
jgi:hypothetical protein